MLWEEIKGWLYEFRILIIALVLVFFLFSVHSCEFRFMIHSR